MTDAPAHARAAGRCARARRQPVRVRPAVHVPARVDGRGGDLGRVAAHVDEPAAAAVRASRRREHARVRRRRAVDPVPEAGPRASAASRSTSRVPRARSSCARSPSSSDVLVENSRSDAMDGFGLGYEQLAAVQSRPRLLRDLRLRLRRARPPRDGQHRAGRVGRDGEDRFRRRSAAARRASRSPITRARRTPRSGCSPRCASATRPGAGQLVDVAMLDVLTASVWDEPVDHYAAIGMPPRTGNADGRGAPINTYRCADGWISVTCTSDRQWQRLCDLMERDDVLERWPTIRERAGAAAEIDAAMEAWTSTRPVREVEAAFLAIGLPAGPGARPDRGRRRRAAARARAAHRAAPSERAGRPAERVPRCVAADLVRGPGRPAARRAARHEHRRGAARARGLRRRRRSRSCAPTE